MNTELSHRPLSPAAYATLIDAAKQRAITLRAEALDAFWSQFARALRSAWRAARHGMHKTLSHHQKA